MSMRRQRDTSWLSTGHRSPEVLVRVQSDRLPQGAINGLELEIPLRGHLMPIGSRQRALASQALAVSSETASCRLAGTPYPVSSTAERLFHTQVVGGSTPPPGTRTAGPFAVSAGNCNLLACQQAVSTETTEFRRKLQCVGHRPTRTNVDA